MIQIAKQPYNKNYQFSIFSDAMALKLILYVLALALPFFAVFSVPRFYLNFVDTVQSSPTVQYNYNYHLIIETTSSSYIYTTLYTHKNDHPISFSYELDEHNQIHTFVANWVKTPSQAVTKATLIVFMAYSNDAVSNGIGLVAGTVQGINMAEGAIIGQMAIKTGDNLLTDPPTSVTFSSFDYDLGDTITSLKKDYSAYLGSDISSMAVNLPTNEFTLKMRLNGGSYSITQSSATILGQLIWSWGQYFPLAFVLWYVVNEIIAFVLRENILKRYLVHDPTFRIR